jgi:hypothetical protein
LRLLPAPSLCTSLLLEIVLIFDPLSVPEIIITTLSVLIN